MISDRPWTTRQRMAVLLILLAFGATAAPAADSGGDGDGDGRIPFPKPRSHEARWIEYHGRAVMADGGSANRPGAACTACHERNDCIACHSMRMPRDHGNFWRTRGHGLQASGDRQRCLACHRQDYCIRCHQETAPRTHTASWQQQHCGWCHYSGGSAPADNCVVCHKQALHVSAPHPVNPAVDCRQCHR